MPQTESLRIVFMGTPDFAAEALRALLGTHHEIVCVYSQPPRPKGRGQQVQKSAVHLLADAHNIPVYTPKSLKSADEQEIFAAHKADVAVVAAYGLLLPVAVLDAPRFGCLNIHASLLPRWRGASPIQRAIWEGDAQSGVTIMQMDVGLDTGPMIAARAMDLGDEMTSSMLHDDLAVMGGEMIADVLNKLSRDGFLDSAAQDEALVSYAHLLKKEDGRIDWTQNAARIDHQIRALNPWPGVFSGDDAGRMKILKAHIIEGQSTQEKSGIVLSRSGGVACGDGSILHVEIVQPAGKQAMDFTSAVNGGYIVVGQKL